MPVKFRDLIAELQSDGWKRVRMTGSHIHFAHPTKPGIVTVPGDGKGGKEVAVGTLKAIRRHAGLDRV